MKLPPPPTTWRSSAMTALRSGGSPHTPRPVMRIAPKPRRATVRSPPIVIVPTSCRNFVDGVIVLLARSRAVMLQARRYVRQDGILARHDGWALFALVEQTGQ